MPPDAATATIEELVGPALNLEKLVDEAVADVKPDSSLDQVIERAEDGTVTGITKFDHENKEKTDDLLKKPPVTVVKVEEEQKIEVTPDAKEPETKAEEKPEETPTETGEQPADTEKTDDTEDVPWWTKVRRDNRKLEKGLRTKEDRIRELESEIEDMKARVEPKEKVDAVAVFEEIATINIDGTDNPARKRELTGKIDLMTAEDLDKVYSELPHMRDEVGEEVSRLASLYQRQIDRRNQSVQNERKFIEDWNDTRTKSIEQLRQIPGMTEKDSPVLQAYLEAADELDEKFPGLQKLADAPLIVLDHLEMKEKANIYNEMAEKNKKLQEQNAQLMAKLNGQDLAPSGGNALNVQKSGREMTPEEEAREELRAAGHQFV